MAIKDKILFLTNSELDAIDMLPVYYLMKPYPEREYLLSKSGIEHYRFLYWIAQNVNNKNIVEIGAYQGLSTACLSSNESNEVFSYDLDFSTIHFRETPHNVNFIPVPDNNPEYFDPAIRDGDIIFVDSWHTGIMEKQIWEYLSAGNSWKGLLIYDDIYYGKKMFNMWNEIPIDKLDITELGHEFGTGVVFFE